MKKLATILVASALCLVAVLYRKPISEGILQKSPESSDVTGSSSTGAAVMTGTPGKTLPQKQEESSPAFARRMEASVEKLKAEIEVCDRGVDEFMKDYLNGHEDKAFQKNPDKVREVIAKFNALSVRPEQSAIFFELLASKTDQDTVPTGLLEGVRPCKLEEKGKIVDFLAAGMMEGGWDKELRNQAYKSILSYFEKELARPNPLPMQMIHLQQLDVLMDQGVISDKYFKSMSALQKQGEVEMTRIAKLSAENPTAALKAEYQASEKFRTDLLKLLKEMGTPTS